MKRPLAYITAPWSENEFENTENAALVCWWFAAASWMKA